MRLYLIRRTDNGCFTGFDRFKCISDCDSCGICAMYKNQDPLLVYKDYIEGVRDFQDITNDYR